MRYEVAREIAVGYLVGEMLANGSVKTLNELWVEAGEEVDKQIDKGMSGAEYWMMRGEPRRAFHG